jgi:hypothetical protein
MNAWKRESARVDPPPEISTVPSMGGVEDDLFFLLSDARVIMIGAISVDLRAPVPNR